MINITLLHVHTYTHTCWVCTILIEGERRDFFFVWIITLGINCFRAQSESTEGLRFPIPPHPKPFCASAIKINGHTLFFYELILNHFYSAEPVREIFA